MFSAGCVPTPHQTQEESAAVPVATLRVTTADLPSTFEAGGVVRARSTAIISSRVMAPITQVHVKPGDRVRRGMTLVTLDARDLAADKSRAEAGALAAAESARAADADVRGAE